MTKKTLCNSQMFMTVKPVKGNFIKKTLLSWIPQKSRWTLFNYMVDFANHFFFFRTETLFQFDFTIFIKFTTNPAVPALIPNPIKNNPCSTFFRSAFNKACNNL